MGFGAGPKRGTNLLGPILAHPAAAELQQQVEVAAGGQVAVQAQDVAVAQAALQLLLPLHLGGGRDPQHRGEIPLRGGVRGENPPGNQAWGRRGWEGGGKRGEKEEGERRGK